MYAVIFKAKINEIDEEYISTAQKMRELAINEYGCIEFISCCENGFEIAISYWNNKDQIRAWKNNPKHREAQFLGQTRWYHYYHVQVVEILREYNMSI